MAIQPPFHGGIRPVEPLIGQGLSSIGGPFAVLNSDTETLTATDNDPWAVKASAHVSHDEVFPLIIPNMGLYLEVYHTWRDDGGAAAVTQTPRILVFGRTPPIPGTPANIRQWPQDVDTSFPDLTDNEFWQLLNEPDNTVNYLDFNTYAAGLGEWEFANAGNDQYFSNRRYVYLAGCEEVFVTISQVAVLTTGVGMIVGRIVG